MRAGRGNRVMLESAIFYIIIIAFVGVLAWGARL